FDAKIDRKMAEWTKLIGPYRGTKIITYHKSFEYFAERFGLVVFGQLEPKPGIEPSPTHINALIPRAKEAGVKLLIVEAYRPRKTPEYVAHTIGAKLVLIPEKVGGNPQTKDYISLFDYDIQQIVNALKYGTVCSHRDVFLAKKKFFRRYLPLLTATYRDGAH